jgi:hypothetical protein
MQALEFSILNDSFTLYRLKSGADIPKVVLASPFYSLTRTEDELSILVPEAVKLATEKSEPGWSALKVAGPLDFSLTGILAGITSTLAQASISIFAISTFDTDYILVKSDQLTTAKAALTAAGHQFRP